MIIYGCHPMQGGSGALNGPGFIRRGTEGVLHPVTPGAGMHALIDVGNIMIAFLVFGGAGPSARSMPSGTAVRPLRVWIGWRRVILSNTIVSPHEHQRLVTHLSKH